MRKVIYLCENRFTAETALQLSGQDVLNACYLAIINDIILLSVIAEGE